MFESAYLKVDRAKKHIADLQAALDRYSKTARIKFQPDGSFLTITIDGSAEPNCSLFLGDAVHNLRTALDHAFWELIGIDGGTQDKWTSFPIHRGERVDYEACCKGIKTPLQDTKDFFIGVQAYPDGAGENLVVLHDLDIGDKHSMLTPVFGLAAICNCVVICSNGDREDWEAIGVPYTRTLIQENGTAVIAPFDRDGRFEPNDNAQATLEVLFGDLDITPNIEPVVPVLDGYVAEVTDTLRRMKRLVDARTR